MKPWLLDWPPRFERLVERYGPRTVWDVGLETLGFPPNWSFPSTEQFRAVETALRNKTRSD